MDDRERQNREAFRRVKEQADAKGWRTCGVILHTGRPHYFAVAPETTDEEIRRISFRLREGRDPSEAELTVGRMLERVHSRGA